MSAWTLSTRGYPEDRQREKWLEAMQQLCLPVGDLAGLGVGFDGRVSCQISPLGMEFALLEGADGMTLSGSYTEQAEGIWLSVNIAGAAKLADEERECPMAPGDIVYGPTGAGATLIFPGLFRQLFIKAPKVALNPRVLVPMSLSVGHISGASGVQRVFSGTLLSLAEVLTSLEPHHLRPVEIAITEFLLTSLVAERAAFGLGGMEGAKAAHFHRVCQEIETVLCEPELSLTMVAQMSGASPRYIQKLFAQAGK
ncbi:MAG: AraC family transcriptional regulator, partial [Pseudomonadota bacterium]